ncbi:MAG: hypothetical protein R2788_04950 [Saprospiraceae bacterium]
MQIAHLVNPFLPENDSGLENYQRITFESMRVAKEYVSDSVRVELLSAQFEADSNIVPAYFKKTPNLDRAPSDFALFSKPKKLPLIRDLLERLYNGSEAEYLIYTNVDIALQPHFYEFVFSKIQAGHDAFIINRRRIPDHFTEIKDLPEMYAAKGKPHPGFDCFVFHRSLFPKFHLENICVGIPFIGIAMAQNLFCYAKNFRLYENEFLTFHIGMEVFKKRDKEYLAFNRKEFWKAMDKMWGDLDSRKFPWGNRNFFYRMIKWGLHPSIPIRLALRLEPKRWQADRC